MAIDATYQDNVVLKQEAFQNLLTNIKNYPIIDIDYIAESDEDELHGDAIWENYTDGIPCIKITYGDERTTKGNIIFAEGKKKEISDHKKAISQAQTVVNELNKRKNRWELVYKENYAVYDEKTKQVERFYANFDQIEYNKIAFLKAGWNLLYISTNLNIDDPYKVVPLDAHYDSHIIYYVHSNEFLFKRYDFTYTENNQEITADVYNGIPAAHQSEMLEDWAEKVANREIYTYNESQDDQGPVIINELGPQFFQYDNILLTKNPFNLVYAGDNYDSNIIYYLRNSASNEFVPYDGNGVDSSSSNYAATEADWRAQVNQRKIYTKDEDTDVKQVYNLTFTSLNAQRARLLSILNGYKNLVDGEGNSIWKEDPDEKEVFQRFINFILSYNKLVFLDTIGIAGYTAKDIETLKEENPNVRAIINRLEEEDALGDFDWESQTNSWNADLTGYYTTFYERIEDIVNTIENVINKNLEYIRQQIRNLSYTIIEYNEYINSEQAIIDALWDEINTISTFKYDKVIEGSVYNPEREYYTLNGNDYVLYTGGASNWNNGAQKYVKNDRTMYGYKYVKVGSNIEFYDTYVTTNTPHTVLTSALEKYNTPDNQASGTFRITINKHIYEVPIKGFGEESNQPITLSTSSTLVTHSKGNTTIRAKNNSNVLQTITLDGNVVTTGTFTAGNNSTINGNLTVNGATGISSTLGVTGATTLSGALTVGNTTNLQSTVTTGTTNGGANIVSGKNETGTLGTSGVKWLAVYAKDLYGHLDGTADKATGDESGNNIKASYAASLSYSNGSLQLLNKNGTAIGSAVTITTNTAGATNNTSKLFLIGATSQSASIQTYSYSDTYVTAGTLHSTKVQNAVFNDYAEYRTTIDLTPGHIVVDNDDGSLSCATQRLQPGAQVISDTFGSSMGKTENAQTPLAVAGRVLVYTYQDRYKYHAGMAVCSAPNGTVDIMTREEIREYPDCIVGIVSEIPEYESWGTDNIKVNGRIWIKVK